MSDDFLQFDAEEDTAVSDGALPKKPWKALIVDDERGIHTITKLALAKLCVDERPIELLHALSGDEAMQLFAEHDDIAVCILDVVMESDQAGLQVAHKVRREFKNTLTRIILRTGEPGQAPEKEIINKYGINGYKEKSELTATRLYTTAHAMISTYRDLLALTRSREALTQIIRLIPALSRAEQDQEFVQAVLNDLCATLNYHSGLVLYRAQESTVWQRLALLGDIDEQAKLEVELSKQQLDGLFNLPNGSCAVLTAIGNGADIAIWAQGEYAATQVDACLLQLYAEQLAVALNALGHS